MERALKAEIKRLCQRARERQLRQEERTEDYREKFQKRTGRAAGVPAVRHAAYVSRHFDPRYCARNANFLAKTIWHKVLTREYRPDPAVNFQIPKPAGGFRSIMAFSIPDAALANLVLWRARGRNLKRLSPFSYAYHPDRNVFDAVLALAGFISADRLFAVQIDFEKYFDSIPTGYLEQCVDNEKLVSLTPDERFVLKEFLHHKFADPVSYVARVFGRRLKGTPQGSSVSLLLANLANHELDRALEKRSGRFVRFADDVVALCGTYEEAQEIQRTFIHHCETSGLVINKRKSPGIAVIEDPVAEIRTFPHFDYLGYRFTKEGLAIPSSVKKRIQAKLSKLIQIYLLQYPLTYGFARNRRGIRPRFDWDLLGLITEIRRYLYGGLSETEVSQFLVSGRRLRAMRGLMGFYPLLDQKSDLQYLDGWLVNNLRRAMRKRAIVLRSVYRVRGLTPSNQELIRGTWLDLSAWRGNSYPERTLPSFVRGWRAARKYYFTFGLEDVEPPSYGYYT